MIKLEYMTAEEFRRYSEFSFDTFVNEVVRSSGQSIEQVRKKVGGPPNKPCENDLWYVLRSERQSIGFIWIQIRPVKKEAFLYDFHIEPAYRSKGFGRKTLVSCIEEVKKTSSRKAKTLRISTQFSS